MIKEIKEHLQLVSLILFVFITMLALNNFVLVNKISSKVMQSLKREYVPGPYEPGFDPDKVPPKIN